MARLKGVLDIQGTIQDMTFYKTQDGNLVKRKGGVSKQRIENDPNFARTRENGEEFGNAAMSGKLVRDTVRTMMLNTADNRVTSRLTKVMTEIKNMDTVNPRGKRNVATGITNPAALELLKNFNFNRFATLGSVLFVPFNVTLTDGIININNFIPLNDIVYPQGATNVKLMSAFAIVDFTNNTSNITYSAVTDLPINGTSSDVILKPVGLPSGTGTKFYLLHIDFYQLVNGVQYQLKNGTFNVLSFVDAV